MKITVDINFRMVMRWVIGLLLVWAAVSKLANVQDFYGSLLAYKMPLPDLFQRWTAIFLPWLELLCGLMLLAKVRTEAALAWSVILFSIFVLATGQAWARGLDISCGCFDLGLFGIGDSDAVAKLFSSVQFAFFRALLLTAGAVYLFRSEMKPLLQTQYRA